VAVGAKEVLVHLSPLLGEWNAPAQPFLTPARDRIVHPPLPWARVGPVAFTRGWCLHEVAQCVRAGLALHVCLSPPDEQVCNGM
jgi:hypothetical protein